MEIPHQAVTIAIVVIEEDVVRGMIDLLVVVALHLAIGIGNRNVVALRKMNAHQGVNTGSAEAIESLEIQTDTREEILLLAETC